MAASRALSPESKRAVAEWVRDGRVLQRTELTPEQSNLLKKLNIPQPPKVRKIDLNG